MSFVKIDKAYRPDTNFWDLNPQLGIMPPFNKLYREDDGGDVSSRKMWCVYFMTDPDEEDNKFYRLPEKERKKMLEEAWCPEIDWEDEVIKECIERYPYVCLTTLQRDLKDQKELLIRINSTLENMPITLDSTDERGRKVQGTLTQITKAKRDLSIVYKQIIELENLVSDEKSKSQVYGGRDETHAEKGLI